jgi:hypothetical protein
MSSVNSNAGSPERATRSISRASASSKLRRLASLAHRLARQRTMARLLQQLQRHFGVEPTRQRHSRGVR